MVGLMVGLGWAEILILVLCAGFFFLSPVIVALILYATQRTRNSPATAPPKAYQPPPGDDRASASATVIARLTQRFCPQCRSPLAADAPEGLCPACLLAGGLAGLPRNATEGVPDRAPVDGLAATTPPSGSQPPSTGEWADLQQHFPQLEI